MFDLVLTWVKYSTNIVETNNRQRRNKMSEDRKVLIFAGSALIARNVAEVDLGLNKSQYKYVSKPHDVKGLCKKHIKGYYLAHRYGENEWWDKAIHYLDVHGVEYLGINS